MQHSAIAKEEGWNGNGRDIEVADERGANGCGGSIRIKRGGWREENDRW